MSSFGEELKRERELREIELRAVAEATKVNIRYLEAIERNDFTHLPGGLFNRGFVRAYAQFIGVDPEAMVNAYLLEEQSQSQQPIAREGVLRGRHGENRIADSRNTATESVGRRRWWLLGVSLVVVVTIVVIAWLRGVVAGGGVGG